MRSIHKAYSVLHDVAGELKNRFEKSNVSLSSAVSTLLPGSVCFSAARLSPLTKLMKQFDIGVFKAELHDCPHPHAAEH